MYVPDMHDKNHTEMYVSARIKYVFSPYELQEKAIFSTQICPAPPKNTSNHAGFAMTYKPLQQSPAGKGTAVKDTAKVHNHRLEQCGTVRLDAEITPTTAQRGHRGLATADCVELDGCTHCPFTIHSHVLLFSPCDFPLCLAVWSLLSAADQLSINLAAAGSKAPHKF